MSLLVEKVISGFKNASHDVLRHHGFISSLNCDERYDFYSYKKILTGRLKPYEQQFVDSYKAINMSIGSRRAQIERSLKRIIERRLAKKEDAVDRALNDMLSDELSHHLMPMHIRHANRVRNTAERFPIKMPLGMWLALK